MIGRATFLVLLSVAATGSGCTAVRFAPVIVTEMRVNPVRLGMAYDYIETGKFDMADFVLKQLEKGEQTPLLTSELAYVRALLAEKQGFTEEAIGKYRAVTEDFPNTPDAYLAAKKLNRLEPEAATASGI